jgi:hypothetical protein
MCEKNGFLLTWKKKHENPSNLPLCYKMVALLPMKVVIYHKLRIQQFHENRLIILQEIILKVISRKGRPKYS